MQFHTKFTNAEVKKFMQSSGDYNPIHWNEAYSSRRPFGMPIVHGALILIRFFNFFFKKELFNLKSLECVFIKPVYINQIIYYKYYIANNEIKVIIRNEKNDILCSFFLNYSKNKSFNEKNEKIIYTNSINHNKKPKIIDKKYINKNKKSKIKFAFVKTGKNKLVFDILNNVSRSIGMELPGLNSLFYKIKITRVNKFTKQPFIQIESFENKINLLQIKYYVSNYNISSSIFLLPNFNNLEYSKEIKKIIKNDNNIFINKKILIIGGSRGIGFITTQFLTLSKAIVTSTYNYNNTDLINFKSSKKIKNLKIQKCNLLEKKDLIELLKNINKFDYIFYYATPKIMKNSNIKFDYDYFNILEKFYLASLKKIVKKINKKMKIFIPSTILIDEKSINFKEYIKAKTKLEKYCKNKYHIKNNILFEVPRLKYFSTDQNFNFLKSNNSNDLIYLYKHLKSFFNEK